MDAEDVGARLDARRRELDLAVDAARAQEGRVQNVQPVCGHDDLDVLGRLEAVELVEQLQHGTLHLGIAARGAFDA